MPPKKATEKTFQHEVVKEMQAAGWRVAHFTPAQARPGVWITPFKADGKGFPDIVAVRSGRCLIVELKRRGVRKLRPEQKDWIECFEQVTSLEVHVWNPSDWTIIKEVIA